MACLPLFYADMYHMQPPKSQGNHPMTKPVRQRTESFHDTKVYEIKRDVSNHRICILSGGHRLTYKGSSVGRRYLAKKVVL